jgi:hypothetical protein
VLVDEIHDELELVQALEVGDFRLIARIDQGLEARADELAAAAAEDGLLAEEVGLGLLRNVVSRTPMRRCWRRPELVVGFAGGVW